MGLSNFNRYQITEHAKVRYYERIDGDASEVKVIKDFRRYLQDATFLSKENRNRESWFYPKEKFVIIINPREFKVITIYSTLDQKEKLVNNTPEIEIVVTPEKEVVPIIENTEVSEVKIIISGLAKESFLKATKKHYEQVAVLYTEYADRMVKLAKTTKPDMFDKKQNELWALSKEIKEVEKNYHRIENEFKTYILEEK